VRRLHRDHWAGLLLMAIGMGAAIASRARPMGTLTEMGAGFFPFALSVVLALLGAAVALAAPRSPTAPAMSPLAPTSLHDSPVVADWRGWGCIVAGVVAFIALGYWFGLAPATFACVFIAAFGDRGTRLPGAALLAAAVTVVGVVVFASLLQLPFPVLQWGPG
jgi:hypothetical protein